MDEGWYLMSVSDLEIELARLRDPGSPPRPSNAKKLTVEQALVFRNRGNLPDEHDRTLRLVLHVGTEPLSNKRLRFEPDYHDAPTWRRDGSRPVNVVPIATGDPAPAPERAWWEQPDVAQLETEWQSTGAVDGLRIPAAYRSFVLKTIASLRAGGIPVGIDTVVGSLARWLSPSQVDEIRAALAEENR